MPTRIVKYFHKFQLLLAGIDAESTNRHAQLDLNEVMQLSPHRIYPVSLSLFHNQEEVRCLVLFDQDTQRLVDIPVDLYERLEEFEMETTEEA